MIPVHPRGASPWPVSCAAGMCDAVATRFQSHRVRLPFTPDVRSLRASSGGCRALVDLSPEEESDQVAADHDPLVRRGRGLIVGTDVPVRRGTGGHATAPKAP